MNSRPAGRFDLPILLLLACLLRLVYVTQLQGEVPNCDEAWRMNVASFTWPDLLRAPFDGTWARYMGLFPWGFVLILKGLGGWSADVLVLRGLSVFFGCLLVLQVHSLLKPIAGRETAVIAGLVVALHPSLLWASQEIKEFSIMACLLMAGLSLLLKEETASTKRAWIAAASCLAAAAFFHPLPAATGWGVLATAALVNRRSRGIGAAFVILGAAFLVLAVPGIHHLLHASDAGHVYHQEPVQPLLFRVFGYLPFMAMRQFVPISCPSGSAYFSLPLLLLALGGFRIVLRNRRAAVRDALIVAGGGWFFFLAVTWGVQLIRPTWVFTRYLVPAIPLLLVAFALSIHALPPALRRSTAALLIVIHLGATAIVAWSPRQGDEYREAARLLARLPEETPVIWNDDPRYAVMRALAPRNRHVWIGPAGQVTPDSWTVVWRNWPGRTEWHVGAEALRSEDDVWVHVNGPVLEEMLRGAGLRPTGERAGLLARFRRDAGGGS